MKILEVTGLRPEKAMCRNLKKHKSKKKRIKDESYGITGGANNPPLSAHLTPTRGPQYGAWI